MGTSATGRTLWVPRYHPEMLPPLIPSSWDGCAIWQWSDGQDPQGPDLSVPGVEGPVDLNVMSADDPVAQLESLRIV